ncbi:MAG: DUF4097 family beta strand repeat-containing protein [Tumebacillaceae bacterium]
MLKSLFGKFDVETVTTKTVELIPTTDVQRLRVEIHNGHITLRQWEQNLVRAVVTVTVASHETETNTDRFWKLEQFGSNVTFEQQPNLNKLVDLKRVRIDVELHLPRNVQAKWETHNGSVDILEWYGDQTGSTHNGSIRIADIHGDVNLTMHNGTIDAERLSRDVTVESHSGDVSVREAGGDVKVSTHNGKIKLDGFAAALRLVTHNGDIDARTTQPLAGEWGLSTHNGDISLQVPADIEAQLRISTHRGKVRGTALPVQVSGHAQELQMTLGSGGREVSLHTHSGNITVDIA